jgi:hypothetical protein
VSDIDTAAADSLKVLDPKRPIREADMAGHAAGSARSRMTAEGMTHRWTLIRRPGSASLVFNVIVIGSPSPVAAACFEHVVVLADFIGWWPIK